MGDDRKVRPFRYTRGKLSFETTLVIITLTALVRLLTWGLRRCKPIAYHPVALAGIVAVIVTYALSAWFTLVLVLSLYVWALAWPDHYLRHAHPRGQSFLAGFYYRHRPRRRLTALGLLNDKDPIPTISYVQKIGCVTKVRMKMSHGDSINMLGLNDRAARFAQTYNALNCTINPYRREQLLPWRHEMLTKPRWVVLEFVTRDPFTSPMGAEFIDHYRSNTLSPVVSINKSGETQEHNLAAHRLRVAMTRWGKSNAIRAMVYAQRDNIQDGLLELWGIDGKGGVEQSFLQHVFARVAYGDSKANPNTYNPAQFDRLLKDAVTVLKRRQHRMRGFVTEHIPTPDEPWLLVVIDELLVLTSKSLNPDLRTSIAASINLIFQQGLACGVSIDASTQLAQKDLLDKINRDGFTEFELGKVEPGAVDMIFGKGWWERGARADEIARDLKGVFYKKTDSTLVPEQIRYPNVPVADVSRRALGFEVEESKLWPPPKRHLEAAPEAPADVPVDIPAPVPSVESEKHVRPELGGFA